MPQNCLRLPQKSVENSTFEAKPAKLIKQKTYVHELGNILSLFLTGDADYFGEPGGVPYAPKPDQKDKDTGAALEKCVFDTPQMVP